MFADRVDAGRQLARRLADMRGRPVVVIGLPRGGVVVARPVADALEVPLDVRIARKLAAPGADEFAIGAVTSRGTRVLYDEAIRHILLPPGYLERVTAEQRQEAERREAMFHGDHAPVSLAGKIALLVDDGIATGMTMFAAIEDAKTEHPSAIVVAAPVIAPAIYAELERRVERVVALETPALFDAVGRFYADFEQTTDEEVRELLASRSGSGQGGGSRDE